LELTQFVFIRARDSLTERSWDARKLLDFGDDELHFVYWTQSSERAGNLATGSSVPVLRSTAFRLYLLPEMLAKEYDYSSRVGF
jgi:hypothetical protein